MHGSANECDQISGTRCWRLDQALAAGRLLDRFFSGGLVFLSTRVWEGSGSCSAEAGAAPNGVTPKERFLSVYKRTVFRLHGGAKNEKCSSVSVAPALHADVVPSRGYEM